MTENYNQYLFNLWFKYSWWKLRFWFLRKNGYETHGHDISMLEPVALFLMPSYFSVTEKPLAWSQTTSHLVWQKCLHVNKINKHEHCLFTCVVAELYWNLDRYQICIIILPIMLILHFSPSTFSPILKWVIKLGYNSCGRFTILARILWL